ncbi:ABC-type glycerol-3-phosphate transport system permease component [Caldalkalibacillus uzonensis]|uniref:ABC-type glycerol-3-phosphate transport system permease component n=1 Tax=Caldalkalibacillus uzonensis TaxID=353224 RepID=A0ABU0CRE7_9BACI|nr:carbohydrate ABC transporter permease [Caldalkalibacillus uzonensis]MDQ0338994.1 ABC-type glycerol-3-phosphate transport system permease component [Caldalkalibacillus uzonensis]
MRQYFLSIPRELEEAARIDGLNRFGIFFRIVLLLSKPALSACTIFAFMGAWNNFMYPLTMARKPEMHVLTVGLQSFRNNFYTEWGPILVGTIIMMVPVLVIFLLFQRHFVRGISTTGLK